MKRLLLLLTPFGIGVFAAGFRVLWLESGGDAARFAGLALGFAAIGYVLALLFGWPGWLLIRRLRLRAAWQVTLVGAVLGAASGALLPLVLGDARARHFFSGLYPYPLEYAFFGALTAYAAWFLVLREAPGRR